MEARRLENQVFKVKKISITKARSKFPQIIEEVAYDVERNSYTVYRHGIPMVRIVNEEFIQALEKGIGERLKEKLQKIFERYFLEKKEMVGRIKDLLEKKG